jgi:acetyl esterase
MDYESESYNEHKDDELLSKVYMKYFWDAYLGNENNATLPTVTPLSASVESLKGLPPALIITAEIDVLRTEGELYAKKLMEAGVDTLCVRYNGAQHGFVTEPGYEAEAALAISQTVDVLKRRWNLK